MELVQGFGLKCQMVVTFTDMGKTVREGDLCRHKMKTYYCSEDFKFEVI